MSKINIADVQALIAFAILNNKSGLIDAMNYYGYPIAGNISDDDLFTAVGTIGDKEGIKKLQTVLSRVPIDKSKLTQEEAKNLAIKFRDFNPNSNPNAKLSDWFKNLGQGIGDFFSGHTVVNQNPNTLSQTSEPVLSPFAILTVAIVGIIAILLINRGEASKTKKTTSWIIGIIILVVGVYGIFATKQTIVQSGGGGNQNIHNGALGWIKGILNGLHLGITG